MSAPNEEYTGEAAPAADNLETGGDPGEGEDGSAGVEEKKGLSRVKESTWAERGTTLAATGAVGISVTDMILEAASGSSLPYVSGGVTSVMAPYAAYQQTKLTDIAALKETEEALRKEVDQLAEENNRLHKNVEELGETVKKLENVEEALDTITQTQNQNIEIYAKQVEENREILNQMQSNLRATVLQNLLSVIIKSDTDGDFSIDESEMDDLIKRLRNIGGVEINEEKFREAIMKGGGNLNAVIDVAKKLLDDGDEEANEIFKITEEEKK
mmetsp:Transcript_2526/g.3830  ORF Transcript_2526/g.3830 Transcript_2526/m.3830 type:complete len:271 (+) Transcript_2526:322-1134(+)|eukprot:CAMPEP_0195527896 /NCGR_PEP_ID=MMETSP0794_2-20130614/29807_1 /TAXON_ID=515487 /ORGANISM="Stephanopyxis turris, Strain CCMP 815" /LENGTH=270 /DNA_ID=CAMNT_0040658915 /DNA_START=301 /DNA_END=1113 /DNA_ORIENTATION=+